MWQGCVVGVGGGEWWWGFGLGVVVGNENLGTCLIQVPNTYG